MTPLTCPFLLFMLAFSPPERISAADLQGDWDMKWQGSDFRQVLDRGGSSDCLPGDGKDASCGWFGVWTQARAGELTIAETLRDLPSYERGGREIEFHLTCKAALRSKDGQARILWLEGSYCGGPLSVRLTRR